MRGNASSWGSVEVRVSVALAAIVSMVAIEGCGSEDSPPSDAGNGGTGEAGANGGAGGEPGAMAIADGGLADAASTAAATDSGTPAHQGNTTLERQTLVGEDTHTESFGSSVSIDGDTLVVSSRDGGSVLGSGAAHVFVRDGATWTLQQKVVAPDPQRYDSFGSPVAVSGDTLVIGGEGSAAGGNVFVFVRSGATWSLQQALAASDDAAGMRFGWSVAVAGDTCVVGAPDDDPSAPGAAYVFRRHADAWTEEARLQGSREFVVSFGRSVSISGDTVLVGAGSRVATTAAYVFTPSGATWSEQAQLIPGDGQDFDVFGGAVAISGDTAVVGAPGVDGSTGAAYVFARSGTDWSEQQKLRGSDSTARNEFGGAVAVDGDTIIVGARFHDSDRGAAYVFTRDAEGWSQRHELRASDGRTGDFLGTSVSASGNTVVSGANTHDGNAAASGAAYVFEL